jgi:hypothetical protein
MMKKRREGREMIILILINRNYCRSRRLTHPTHPHVNQARHSRSHTRGNDSATTRLSLYAHAV